MKKSLRLGILAVVVAAAGLIAYAVYVRSGRREPVLCEACRRLIMPRTAFSVEVGRRTLWTCCPRCWLDCYRTMKGDMRNPTATDYVSQRRVPAEQCLYVEGSDLSPCCAPEVMLGADQTVMDRCYDRCMPSVIAFAVPAEAERFAKEHGGKVMSFQTLTDEAKEP